MIGRMMYNNVAALETLFMFLFSGFHFVDTIYHAGDTKRSFHFITHSFLNHLEVKRDFIKEHHTARHL